MSNARFAHFCVHVGVCDLGLHRRVVSQSLDTADTSILQAFLSIERGDCHDGELARRATLIVGLECGGDGDEFYVSELGEGHFFWIQHGVARTPLAPLRGAGVEGGDLWYTSFLPIGL